MPIEWDKLFSGLTGDTTDLVKTQLSALVTTVKTDGGDSAKEFAGELEDLLNRLARGELSKDDFEEESKELRYLVDIEIKKEAVIGKVQLMQLSQGITTLILDRLMKLIA
ncbi:MAG: hypothetical protein HY075_01650 [Deltaproteobacteria bacterium]|nr:hypothetical protein [Deltaproteobacteria bacterium]